MFDPPGAYHVVANNLKRYELEASRERFRSFLEDNPERTLTKPVSANELWSTLANLLNQRATSSRPPPRG